MKKKHRRRMFFLFLLVSFIWSQSVIGMNKPYGLLLFSDGKILIAPNEFVGIGAVGYKGKTKEGKDQVVALVILDGPAEVSYPLNSNPKVRYAKHRKVLLDLAHKKDIRYAYLAPKSSSTPEILRFNEFSYLKKLNKHQMQCKLSQIDFKDLCNEEDDAMRIVLICKDHYDFAHNLLLSLKFKRQCKIPFLTSEKTTDQTDHLKVCFALTILPVTPLLLKEFLLNLHGCCGMCAKKIKPQDDKIHAHGKKLEFGVYCSSKCLKKVKEKNKTQ